MRNPLLDSAHSFGTLRIKSFSYPKISPLSVFSCRELFVDKEMSKDISIYICTYISN